VESLVKSPHWADCEVVIVDNRSAAEDVAELMLRKQDHPRMHLVLNEANLGYFRGLNTGIRYLREHFPGLDLMMIGNNDLVFPREFVDSVRAIMPLLESQGVISPDIVTLDGVHQNPHVIAEISRTRRLIYDLYYASYPLALAIRWFARATHRFTRRSDSDSHRIAGPIHMGYGACYLLGPQFFRHFEELWAPTFLMGEEAFLSKQLRDKGLKVYYEPSVQVQHYDHASVNKLPSRQMWLVSREAHKVYRQYEKMLSAK
jgi:GT2 family glycosyltransferase